MTSARGPLFAFVLICGTVVLLFAVVKPSGRAIQQEQSPSLPSSEDSKSKPQPSESYLLCFWNVENLFDDKKDNLTNTADREFDSWFSENPAVRERKLECLTEVLLAMNSRHGPDIIALAEVEGHRAAELLTERLNRRLGKSAPHYTTVLAEDIPDAARHITPAVISRLPAVKGRTQLLGSKQRILQCELTANGHNLVLVASHWTARVSDTQGQARGRYGDVIYRDYRKLYGADPKVDFLVCGDFNDEPDATSVRNHLHAIGADDAEKAKVRAGGAQPLLLNLFAATSKEIGTHNYRNQWSIFDQIAVSPGMLDNQGWSCEPATAEIYAKSPPADRRPPHRPRRFGGPNDRMPLQNRGYSDHLPVTVQLKVAATR